MMTLSTGFTCPPTIYFQFIKKCDKCDYKVRQLFYYKVENVLWPSETDLTKCDNFITKCDSTQVFKVVVLSWVARGVIIFLSIRHKRGKFISINSFSAL